MFSLLKAKSSRYSYKVNPKLYTGHADSYVTEVNNVKNIVLNFSWILRQGAMLMKSIEGKTLTL